MEDYKDLYAPPARQPEQPAEEPPQQEAIPFPLPEHTNAAPLPQSSPPPRPVPPPAQERPAPQQPASPVQPETPQGQTNERPYYQRYQVHGSFYADPNAPTGNILPVRKPVPPPPKPEPIPINRSIMRLSLLSCVLIFLLCIYCLGADIVHGALGSSAPQTEEPRIVITQQASPKLDPDDENVTADGEYTVSHVAEMVMPSIVEVYTYADSSREEDLLLGTGSGIIITEDGCIITNAHVVQGKAFSVRISEEETYDATLLGSDVKTDLAVLKIHASGLKAAVAGDSDDVFIGQNVLAIGNPAGLTNSVTRGIVSGIDRQVRADSTAFVMNCIQTDAAISPGNSGGALVNMYGQVIGITSSKYASSYSSTYEGLGFAITINQALPIIQDIIEQGYVSGRFRVGITLSSTSYKSIQTQFESFYHRKMPEELRDCIWIEDISEDCDISTTELQPHDFILSVQGQKVTNYDSVMEALRGMKGGDTVSASCARCEDDGSITYFDITFKLETDTSGNF